jgi:hypothetical protein
MIVSIGLPHCGDERAGAEIQICLPADGVDRALALLQIVCRVEERIDGLIAFRSGCENLPSLNRMTPGSPPDRSDRGQRLGGQFAGGECVHSE